MVLAGLMGGTGLYLCPMGLVAPFAGFTIVTNSLFAKWFLKESLVNVKVLGRGPIDVEVWGTGLVVAGTISCTTFGPHDEKQYSSEQLLKLFFSSEMMVHYIFTCVLLVSCIVVVRKPEYNKSFYEAFAYANMAGMIGGNQNLVLKTTMVYALTLPHPTIPPCSHLMVFCCRGIIPGVSVGKPLHLYHASPYHHRSHFTAGHPQPWPSETCSGQIFAHVSVCFGVVWSVDRRLFFPGISQIYYAYLDLHTNGYSTCYAGSLAVFIRPR